MKNHTGYIVTILSLIYLLFGIIVISLLTMLIMWLNSDLTSREVYNKIGTDDVIYTPAYSSNFKPLDADSITDNIIAIFFNPSSLTYSFHDTNGKSQMSTITLMASFDTLYKNSAEYIYYDKNNPEDIIPEEYIKVNKFCQRYVLIFIILTIIVFAIPGIIAFITGIHFIISGKKNKNIPKQNL